MEGFLIGNCMAACLVVGLFSNINTLACTILQKYHANLLETFANDLRFFEYLNCQDDSSRISMKLLHFLIFIALLFQHPFAVFGSCTQDKDCENGGACVSDRCQCALGFVGDRCQQSSEDYLGDYYKTYYYITFIANFFVFVASCLKFGHMYRVNNKITMKHFSILLMVIATLLRTISYGTELDGNWKRSDHIEPVGGLLFFLFYSLCLSAYLCELFIWIELYTATTLHHIEYLPTLKKAFIGINAFLFPLEFATRIILAELQGTPTAALFFAVWTIYVGLLTIIQTVGFFIMAGLLVKKMMKIQAISGAELARSQFIRVSILTLSNAVLLLLGLAIIVWFFFATDVWTWYGLLWFSRVVEFGFVICLLVTVRPPQPSTSRGASLQMSTSIRGSRKWNSSDEATIGASKQNTQIDYAVDSSVYVEEGSSGVESQEMDEE